MINPISNDDLFMSIDQSDRQYTEEAVLVQMDALDYELKCIEREFEAPLFDKFFNGHEEG